jgi:hypothetical protein
MIRDPEKNLFRIPDPWVKKAPDPGSGSAKLLVPYSQCCGSGSGIRDWVLFDPWIRDPE